MKTLLPHDNTEATDVLWLHKKTSFTETAKTWLYVVLIKKERKKDKLLESIS
jgi:hypothetical protein